MRLVWEAVQTGNWALAMPAYFPEGAYVQLKALDNDVADYVGRLVPHFQLDVNAAHQLLGPVPATARLVETLVPSWQAAWVGPGACFNRLGYWHVGGARMVYEDNGQERSFGIASMISWRGYWYVVHLGSVLPPDGEGVVDAPTSGPGAYGPPGGC